MYIINDIVQEYSSLTNVRATHSHQQKKFPSNTSVCAYQMTKIGKSDENNKFFAIFLSFLFVEPVVTFRIVVEVEMLQTQRCQHPADVLHILRSA